MCSNIYENLTSAVLCMTLLSNVISPFKFWMKFAFRPKATEFREFRLLMHIVSNVILSSQAV